MSDRLALAHAFEDAGMARDKAEHVASVVLDAIHDNVATKTDLQMLAQGTKADLLAVEQRLTGNLAVAVRDMKIWTGSVLVALFTVQLVLGGLLIRFLPPQPASIQPPPAAASMPPR
jgi:hypothetical protein